MQTRLGVIMISQNLMGGGAESHYACLSTKELCELPIKSISADNSVLLMWVTYPQLKEGLDLMKSWGFTYKTVAFTWVKTYLSGKIAMGMGRYTRANAEICLLGTKGKGIKRQSASVYNTQIYPRGVHSQKPLEFRNEIIRLFGDISRLELFARQKTEGWHVWGNEVDSDIIL